MRLVCASSRGISKFQPRPVATAPRVIKFLKRAPSVRVASCFGGVMGRRRTGWDHWGFSKVCSFWLRTGSRRRYGALGWSFTVERCSVRLGFIASRAEGPVVSRHRGGSRQHPRRGGRGMVVLTSSWSWDFNCLSRGRPNGRFVALSLQHVTLRPQIKPCASFGSHLGKYLALTVPNGGSRRCHGDEDASLLVWGRQSGRRSIHSLDFITGPRASTFQVASGELRTLSLPTRCTKMPAGRHVPALDPTHARARGPLL